MSVQITSTNYNNQSANVTLFSSTGNTIPYTSASTISLGVQTIPFTYSSATISDEYGVFSCNFTGYSKTCIINQQTPPDGDGNTYDTIKIGNQIWMSENLKTTKYQDGTPLDNTGQTTNDVWAVASASGSTKYWALVNGTTANTQTYGLVYNQFAVTGSTTEATANVNLCPSGWHVPTSAEFSTLVTTLGTNPGTQAKSTTLWNTSTGYIPGTNSSGFNGLPPGARNYTDGNWLNFSSHGYFWTTSSGVSRLLNFTITSFVQLTYSSLYGFSVRCLRN
jgi:uncharacterized protein (TIGR02145 family)